MLKMSGVSFAYSSKLILENLTLSIKSGEIVTLIGTSGSGKSTLFKLLTGLLPLKQGAIAVAGNEGPDRSNAIAYMMQEDLLLPWRTVIDNLLLPTELGTQKSPSSSLVQEARSILADLGLANCERQYPRELSGGMRQRVSLARAIFMKRPVLLLDEPFSALDVCLREQMHRHLRHTRDQQGTTILLITHDFRDALSLSDRVLLLKNRSIHQEWNIPSNMTPEEEGRLIKALRTAMSSSGV